MAADNISGNGSTPSTPGQGPSSLGSQEFADEPIHIINVSLQCNNLEHLNDAELSRKCHQYIHVSLQNRPIQSLAVFVLLVYHC